NNVPRRFSVLTAHRPPTYELFPYTTLFRSYGSILVISKLPQDPMISGTSVRNLASSESAPARGMVNAAGPAINTIAKEGVIMRRSEEHTSELQSRGHLVCRLLLEKKNRQLH